MGLYVRSESVVSRVIAGETLIVPISKGVGDLASIYSLSPVASAIWESLVNPRSEKEIVDRIVEEFDGDAEEIHRDVDSFIAEMKSAGLVRSVAVAEAI